MHENKAYKKAYESLCLSLRDRNWKALEQILESPSGRDVASHLEVHQRRVIWQHALSTKSLMESWMLEVVVEVLQQSLMEPVYVGKDYSIPVYIALTQEGIPKHLLMRMIDLAPHATRMRMENGGLLLHVGARYLLGCDALKAIYYANPEAIQIPDFHGNLPLHIALASPFSQHRRTCTHFLMSEYPDAAKHPDKCGQLPLHLAAKLKHVPIDLFRRILDINPDAVQAVTSNGESPLNIACRTLEDTTQSMPIKVCGKQTNQSIKVIYLLKTFPEVVLIKDANGELPIQTCKPLQSVIFNSLRHDPDLIERLATVFDSECNNIAHLLVNAHDNVMEPLLEAIVMRFPLLLSKSNHRGELPLHTRLRNTSRPISFEEIRLLCTSYPDAAVALDRVERLYPFMFAAISKSDAVSSTFILLQVFLSSRSIMNL